MRTGAEETMTGMGGGPGKAVDISGMATGPTMGGGVNKCPGVKGAGVLKIGTAALGID